MATAGTMGSGAVRSVLGTPAETALLAATAGLFPELALQGQLTLSQACKQGTPVAPAKKMPQARMQH